MIINIEGCDGVGKTAVSRLVAEHYGYKCIEKPMHELFADDGIKKYIEMRLELDKINSSKLYSMFFGLNALLLAEKYKNENIVCSRGLVSNFAWIGENLSARIFKTVYSEIDCHIKTFLLYAPPAVLEERMLKRNPSDANLKNLSLSERRYELMRSLLKDENIPYIEIDTSNAGIDDVLKIIIKSIDDREF